MRLRYRIVSVTSDLLEMSPRVCTTDSRRDSVRRDADVHLEEAGYGQRRGAGVQDSRTHSLAATAVGATGS